MQRIALAANYCLIASGFVGDGTLWALDFAKYGLKLAGPAVGAIATKKRDGGGHVFFVAGRTENGMIVGRGGNQSDMVCDELFVPNAITGYNWPAGYPQPARLGLASLPIVPAWVKMRRKLAALPSPVSAGAPAPSIPLPPAQTPPSAPTSPAEPPLRGDPLVWRVQRILGFADGDLDGEFGAKTEAAVKRFQVAHWLDPSGEVDGPTWALLDRAEMEQHTSPDLRGDTLHYRVQRLLGFQGDNLDGEWGQRTRAAVMRFQSEQGLDADGEVGPLTWAALERLIVKADLPPSATAPPALAPALPNPPATAPASSGLFSWLGRLFGRKG